MTFERITKYEVMKIDDIEKYLSSDQKAVLDGIIETLQEGRERDGKPAESAYVVVNEDEPYAEDVWDLIEQHEALQRVWNKIQADPELSDFWDKFCYFIT